MRDAEEIWRGRSDEQLVEAARHLDEYTEDGRSVIRADLLRRGLDADPGAIQNALNETSMAGSPASLGDRLVGQMLDSVVAVVPLGSIVLFGVSEWVGPVAISAGLAFAVLYVLFADGLPNGQSYGKRLVKTAVRDAASQAPCSSWQSFVRNLPLVILGVIDWVFIFGKRRQRLGDKLARTVVIYARR
jgi:hypothetical protein